MSIDPCLPAYDVVVLGAGGSGLAAAVSAAQQGLSVLLLERQATPGGTTAIAVGSFTANRTAWQRSAGIDDSMSAHDEDAGKFPAPDIECRNHESLRRFFLEHAGETLDWLRSLGLEFEGPHAEPPNRVPRMHTVTPNGSAYIAILAAELERLGGTLQCNATVTRLIRQAGRVAGVSVVLEGATREILARRGVVLACGDYAGNAGLIAQHKGDAYRQIEGINPHATGDGHHLAESVGAKLVNMDVAYGPELRFVAPPSGLDCDNALPPTWMHPENALFDDGAILINAEGKRFCNERQWPGRELAVSAQPDKSAWLLLDERLSRRYAAWPHYISTAPQIAYAYVDDYLSRRPDIAFRGSLIDAARQAHISEIDLAGTVKAFNLAARNREADAFGRIGEHPLDGDPWVILGPVRAYFTTTEGGAAIDQQCRVLDEKNAPIPGLYAVGQNGLGGQILFGHGLHIAWALTSGRLAGKAIAHCHTPSLD